MTALFNIPNRPAAPLGVADSGQSANGSPGLSENAHCGGHTETTMSPDLPLSRQFFIASLAEHALLAFDPFPVETQSRPRAFQTLEGLRPRAGLGHQQIQHPHVLIEELQTSAAY